MKRWEVDEGAVAKMLAEPTVASYLLERARMGVDKARANAPVLSGRYRDSLGVGSPRVEDDVLVVPFGSDSPRWHFVEFGTASNAAHRVLGNAAETVADKVEHL